MKEKKKRIIIVFGIAIIIVVVGIFIVSKGKGKNNSNTTIENNIAISEVEVEKVTFKNITKVYDEGITTLRAEMMNNTKKTKNFTVKIILKDDEGKELKSLIQVVENLEPSKKKILSTGILGDYTNIKDIQFQIID